MKKTRIVLGVLIVVFLLVPRIYGYEIDRVSTVTHVIDGDPFYIVEDEVRLADVSAPEWNEIGGSEATELLTELIMGKTVYLDIDDKSGRDRYGRLIAVVYLELNETHYLNVNYFLLYSEVYELTDYTNNEWDPYDWNLVERYAYLETESSNEKVEESDMIQFDHGLAEIDKELLNETPTEVIERLNNSSEFTESESTEVKYEPSSIPGFPLYTIFFTIALFFIRSSRKAIITH